MDQTSHVSGDIGDIKEKINVRLEGIAEKIKETKKLLRNNAPCDTVFQQFTGIKEETDEAESLLLAYQLENCLLPKLGHFQEVVEVLNRLIKRKYGALMAIQRNDALSYHAMTGTPLDAVISAPLIESIFYPGNPLHDGAIIINNDRIAAAGCVLPLSQKTLFEHGKAMGMRHRAALGLSEQTDALVAVVSEETQRVSLALGGHLYRLKKTTDLWKEIHGVIQADVD